MNGPPHRIFCYYHVSSHRLPIFLILQVLHSIETTSFHTFHPLQDLGVPGIYSVHDPAVAGYHSSIPVWATRGMAQLQIPRALVMDLQQVEFHSVPDQWQGKHRAG